MPKKTEVGEQYIKAATESIKSAGSLRSLYTAIHGTNPTKQELKRFSNRLNPERSNPGADMLGVCIEHLPSLHQKTLKDFFCIQGEASLADQGKVTPLESDLPPDPDKIT